MKTEGQKKCHRGKKDRKVSHKKGIRRHSRKMELMPKLMSNDIRITLDLKDKEVGHEVC